MKTALRILTLATAGAAALGLVLSAAPSGASASGGSVDGRVTADGGLRVRQSPAVSSPVQGRLDEGQSVPIACRTDGTDVDGDTTWYALPPTLHEWVSARYVDVEGSVPECGGGDAPDTVRATTGLLVRRGPTTSEQVLGTTTSGEEFWVECRLRSQRVAGDDLWYKLRDAQGWVSAGYVTGATPGWCTV